MSKPEERAAYAKDCAAVLRKLGPVDLELHLRELEMTTGFPREVLMA